MSMTGNTTKATSQSMAVIIDFYSNPTSTSKKRLGRWPPKFGHEVGWSLCQRCPGSLACLTRIPLLAIFLSSHDHCWSCASVVSAVNFHLVCLPSLLKALANSQPGREVWLSSFFEKRCAIQRLDKYCKSTLGEYCVPLRERISLAHSDNVCLDSQ